MAKIADEFGYVIKISDEDMLAISLVDNGINPYKKIKKKSLQHKVKNEYKRRLIINIIAFLKKSSKNKEFLIRKLKIKTKTKSKSTVIETIQHKLNKMHVKNVDKLNNIILHHGRTQKRKVPKHSKTRKIRK
tara:strand:+ start:224 stop:619 length:396 start_codon:yes stop_codon:yes gene_type:complete